MQKYSPMTTREEHSIQQQLRLETYYVHQYEYIGRVAQAFLKNGHICSVLDLIYRESSVAVSRKGMHMKKGVDKTPQRMQEGRKMTEEHRLNRHAKRDRLVRHSKIQCWAEQALETTWDTYSIPCLMGEVNAIVVTRMELVGSIAPCL